MIKNERIKLSATYLNGMAIAVFAVGGLAQFFGESTRITQNPGTSFHWGVLASGLASFAISIILHMVARRLLGGMDE